MELKKFINPKLFKSAIVICRILGFIYIFSDIVISIVFGFIFFHGKYDLGIPTIIYKSFMVFSPMSYFVGLFYFVAFLCSIFLGIVLIAFSYAFETLLEVSEELKTTV